MSITYTALEHLLNEHRALLAHYGRAQLRCTQVLTRQAREIERLQAEAIRLRARMIVRETQLAYAQQDAHALAASLPGLPRRKALVRQMEGLAMRLQERAREVLHWQWRADRVAAAGHSAPPHPALHQQPADGGSTTRSVLCIAPGEAGGWITRRMVDGPLGLVPDVPARGSVPAAAHVLAAECDDSAALEASLIAADLVICQTGCLGHNDYWRVQDHCKRTGKTCVMVDSPQVVHWMRGLRPEGVSAVTEHCADMGVPSGAQ